VIKAINKVYDEETYSPLTRDMKEFMIRNKIKVPGSSKVPSTIKVKRNKTAKRLIVDCEPSENKLHNYATLKIPDSKKGARRLVHT
jgi:hypothetical protein